VTGYTSWDRRKEALIPYWVDKSGVFKEVVWDKKPSEDHHPLAWADRPISKERLKELWVQAEGKPLPFARLVEMEHGVKNWEIDNERANNED
jgi:hypothetical protein